MVRGTPARRTVAIALVAVAALPAQREKSVTRTAPVDPYTGGAPEALEKAGYSSLGPFRFGRSHSTGEVSALLGDEPLAWIETAHFRIGCSLAPLSLRGDQDWTDRVKRELKELKPFLPSLKPETRDLDPWLRAHLYARRCEALYAEIEGMLAPLLAGLPEPGDARGEDPKGEPHTFRGLGPHLGKREKIAVLIVRKGSSKARYSRQWQSGESMEPMRHHEAGAGLTFAIAEEAADRRIRDDLELHTQLVYNLACALYEGYRHNGHALPPWLLLGLSHWHGRRISPKYPAYERRIDGEREIRHFWQWDERVRGLLANKAFEPVAALMARTETTTFGMEQHIQAWAIVDWLMQTQRPATMKFLHDFKDPFHQLERAPSPAEWQARHADCLQRAFGKDAAAFEAAWRAHTLRGKGR